MNIYFLQKSEIYTKPTPNLLLFLLATLRQALEIDLQVDDGVLVGEIQPRVLLHLLDARHEVHLLLPVVAHDVHVINRKLVTGLLLLRLVHRLRLLELRATVNKNRKVLSIEVAQYLYKNITVYLKKLTFKLKMCHSYSHFNFVKNLYFY